MIEADPLEGEEEEAGVVVPEVVASAEKACSTQIMLSSIPAACFLLVLNGQHEDFIQFFVVAPEQDQTDCKVSLIYREFF